MKRRIYICGAILLFLLLAVGGCRKAGTWLVRTDDPAHADVMIMLMGDFSERVLQVVDNYTGGVSGKVWIVEEGMGAYRTLEERGVQLVSNSTQAINAMITLGIPADSITLLPDDAGSTMAEAKIIRDYLATQTGIGSVLLVTSSTHTRRAYKLFRAAFHPLEDPPVVYCSSNPYTIIDAEKWWRSKNNIQKVTFEYLKLLNFTLFERGKLRKGEPG